MPERPDAVLPTVAARALEITHADAVLIYTYDAATDRFNLTEAIGIDKNANGGEMKISGRPVTGIGVHAPSSLVFDIARHEGEGRQHGGGHTHRHHRENERRVDTCQAGGRLGEGPLPNLGGIPDCRRDGAAEVRVDFAERRAHGFAPAVLGTGAVVKRAVRMLNRKGDVHDLWQD